MFHIIMDGNVILKRRGEIKEEYLNRGITSNGDGKDLLNITALHTLFDCK